MREVPRDVSPPKVERPAESSAAGDAPAVVREERHYRLITPLFGGGVAPQEADPVTPIRGTSIRGQLRFWWRACRGGRFGGDLAAMREAEAALWGAASTPGRPTVSRISIEADAPPVADRFQAFTVQEGKKPGSKTIVPDHRIAAYAGFPLQPEYRTAFPGMDTAKVMASGYEFSLTIAYLRDDEEDIEAALWAWETFGGIGGRTRRGFGALQLIKRGEHRVVPPLVEEVEQAIRKGLAIHVVSGPWPQGVPHLTQHSTLLQIASLRQGANVLQSWKYLIDRLRAFRQGWRDLNTRSRPEGRSQWPEPDEIRRRVNSSHPQHLPRTTPRTFPRAAFGLPIIFHFKDARDGDPQDTTLKGVSAERLASRLILRPLACTGNRGVGIALVLDAPTTPPGGLALDGAPSNPTQPAVTSNVSPGDAQAIPPLSGDTDVLRAFLKTL